MIRVVECVWYDVRRADVYKEKRLKKCLNWSIVFWVFQSLLKNYTVLLLFSIIILYIRSIEFILYIVSIEFDKWKFQVIVLNSFKTSKVEYFIISNNQKTTIAIFVLRLEIFIWTFASLSYVYLFQIL